MALKLCFSIGFTLPLNKFVILFDESYFGEFVCEIHDMHYVPHTLKDYGVA